MSAREDQARLLTELTDADPHVRGKAAIALGWFPNSEVIAALIEAMPDGDGAVTENIVDALVRIGGDEATAALTALVGDHRPGKWKCAARALGKLATPSALKTLAEACRSQDPDVRTPACNALVDAGAAAGPYLIEGLKHKDAYTRARTAMALGRIKARFAIDDLIQAAEDDDASVRLEAILALAAIRDNAAIPALIDRLQDEDPAVRQTAPLCLGEIGTHQALEALRLAVDLADEEVRWVAQWELKTTQQPDNAQ